MEGYYRTDPGQRVNNDVEQRQLSGTFKAQVTPQDTVYLQVKQYEANSGDLSQYYNPTNANPAARVNEDQTPNIGLGYHHEWSPGVHTLLFVTRLEDSLSVTNPAGPTLVAFVPFGSVTAVQGINMHEQFQNDLTIYSGELQQIWQTPGAQYHPGHTNSVWRFRHSQSAKHASCPFPLYFQCHAAHQELSSLFRRISVYGYHQWQVFDPLQLIGGVAYDRITFPENFPTAPVSGTEPNRRPGFSQGRPDLDAAGRHHLPFRLYPLAGRREPGPKLSIGAFAGGGLHPILPEHHPGIGGRTGSRCEFRNVWIFAGTKIFHGNLSRRFRQPVEFRCPANSWSIRLFTSGLLPQFHPVRTD